MNVDLSKAHNDTVVRNHAEDPAYNPYCMRCPGLIRMRNVEPFFWRCSCGAEHDERQVLAGAVAPETTTPTRRAHCEQWTEPLPDAAREQLHREAGTIIGEVSLRGTWRMSVPVRDEDSDMVMAAVLMDAGLLARRVKELESALTTAQQSPGSFSDARHMHNHLRGCSECSSGEYCDEGERYGGDVTHAYLTRITEGNGCRPDAVQAAIATRRASTETPPPRIIRARDDWRYRYLRAAPRTAPEAEMIVDDAGTALLMAENALNELGSRGSAGVYLFNPTLLAMRRVLESLAESRASLEARDSYAENEHRARVEAELENQGLRLLLDELAGWAVALRDPIANAYDGASTRSVIVQRLQGYHDKHCAGRDTVVRDA